jgi:NAD(P)-dependent dehydrogenase (short-subunit alcohol dehydrogenase family)
MPETSQTQGRVVLITGAATGIGLATAKAFALAGDTVVLTDRDAERVARRAADLGPPHLAMTLDVSDEAAVVKVIGEVAARFGRLDVLVNNAGVDDPGVPLLEKPLSDIRQMMAINVEGPFLAAREAGKIMLTQGEGAIINIASGAALIGARNRAPYGSFKAALLGMTRALASEWTRHGVRVNAVLPGFVATEMLSRTMGEGSVVMERMERSVPLGRLAEPKDIAGAVVHLAGATYTAGISLQVDGGVVIFRGAASASMDPAPFRPAEPGRVVVVTGGAGGIGAAIADRFVAEGARVVALDYNPDLIAALPADRTGYALDVADEEAVEATMADIVRRFGPIAVLVNNAAVIDPAKPTVDQSLADFRRVMDIDLIGALVAARAAARSMIEAGGGAIVNIASIAASGGSPRRNAYCGAKAGVVGMTQNLACEWASSGIRVNAVSPGFTETATAQAAAKDNRTAEYDIIRMAAQRVPVGRWGRPEEIAGVVAFLASDDASYITGINYLADGGFDMYGGVAAAADVA